MAGLFAPLVEAMAVEQAAWRKVVAARGKVDEAIAAEDVAGFAREIRQFVLVVMLEYGVACQKIGDRVDSVTFLA